MKRFACILLAVLCLNSCSQRVDGLPGNGQWRVVNYWAIWCVPCRKEIPDLNALDENTELLVYAVNYDNQQGEALRKQATEMGISFTLLEHDPSANLGIERPRVLPTTLLVDPKGSVTDMLVGPQTRESLIKAWHRRAGY